MVKTRLGTEVPRSPESDEPRSSEKGANKGAPKRNRALPRALTGRAEVRLAVGRNKDRTPTELGAVLKFDEIEDRTASPAATPEPAPFSTNSSMVSPMPPFSVGKGLFFNS